MKPIRVAGIVMSLAVACPAFVFAQAKDQKEQKQKSPADLAYDAFMELRNDKEAKPTPARFQKLSKAGVNFIAENPKHGRASAVIGKLLDFAGTLQGKDKALRAGWFAQVQLDVINRQFDEKLTDEGKAALVALEAATFEGESKESPTKDNVGKWREKIDALAQMPGSGGFLKDREVGFVEFLKLANPRAVEPQVKKLTESPDKNVANWARDELKFVELRKQPVELTLTTLDGKPLDLATLHGKVVYLMFWSSESAGSDADLDALLTAYSDHGRRVFEVVAVCCDKAENREKAAAYLKKNKIKWPVAFDQPVKESELAKRFAVKNLPAGHLIDMKGNLAKTGVRMGSVGGEVKKLVEAK